jgi:hypothetical protein
MNLEVTQDDVDRAVAEENADIQALTINHLQRRVIRLRAENTVLKKRLLELEPEEAELKDGEKVVEAPFPKSEDEAESGESGEENGAATGEEPISPPEPAVA